MKQPYRIVLGIALAILGAMILSRTWGSGHQSGQKEIAPLIKKPKTVCVGRFLVDLPGDAQIEMSPPRIDGFEITAFKESDEQFQKRIAEREVQLRSKPDWQGGDQNLESIKEVKTSSGLVGKIFIHSRTVKEGTQGNGLGGVERYRHEGITTEALVHGHGISIDLFYKDRNPDLVEDLPRLVNQLVPNPDNRIPTEPGFCTDRAYVRDPLRADQREQIMMFAGLPSHPDVQRKFLVAAGLKPDVKGLLERNKDAGSWMAPAQRMRFTTLRAAPRNIAGLSGEEVAELVIEENDARVHSFMWDVNGTEDNVFVPHVLLEMSTGNGNRVPVASSLSDGAALGLCDKISSSIRLRMKPAAQPRPTLERSKPPIL